LQGKKKESATPQQAVSHISSTNDYIYWHQIVPDQMLITTP